MKASGALGDSATSGWRLLKCWLFHFTLPRFNTSAIPPCHAFSRSTLSMSSMLTCVMIIWLKFCACVSCDFLCTLSTLCRVCRYLGQWTESLAAYHSALATATQASKTGATVGDVESSCDETLAAIMKACLSAEKSIYKQQGVALKPSSIIPEYDLGPGFISLTLERRRKPGIHVRCSTLVALLRSIVTCDTLYCDHAP